MRREPLDKNDSASPIKQPGLHYTLLIGIVLVGTVLRFWQLDAKPLWLDEVITALFTLGHRQADVPVNGFFPLSALSDLFAFQPGVSCAQIAQTVATESVHPPLFFCLLYRWIGWLQPDATQWVWAMRSLPALFGVGAIAAVYGLNRMAISPTAGLMGAALMAVSPFAVYLSQEARHYTLPMMLATLGLIALIRIQKAIAQHRRISVWLALSWVAVNIAGLYVHYFFILVVIAQFMALALWISTRWQRVQRLHHYGGTLVLSLSVIVVSYLPWLPIVLAHFDRPETDWLIPYKPDWRDRIAPLYQTVMGWVLMGIALPVENQPWFVILPSALIMLAIGGWLAWQVIRGIRQLWHTPTYRASLIVLGGFVGGVILQFLAIAYILDKDITSVPRYNFVYYPGMSALVAAGLSVGMSRQSRQGQPIRSSRINRSAVAIAILAGLVSSSLVVHGWVFQKGYYPHTVAEDMAFDPSTPLMLVVSYQSLQEIALGLSFVLELDSIYATTPNPPVRVAFVHRENNYRDVWRTLARMRHELSFPLNLWVVASPGMKTEDYPTQLKIRNLNRAGKSTCTIDPDRFNRIGFPYQLFRCGE
ncbi:MAG: glycosyltransferase family 39 protein [Elainellaceae cyanobacterium]